MTAQEIIDQVDKLAPNQYPPEQKLEWLADFDGKVFHEQIMTHWDCLRSKAYTEADYSKPDVVMLIPAPYAREVYANYLLAKIAEANTEVERYNLYSALFNAEYGQFCAWYNRTVKPRQGKGWRF